MLRKIIEEEALGIGIGVEGVCALIRTVAYSTGSIAAGLSTILDIASYIFSMVALVQTHRYVQARDFRYTSAKDL